MEQSSISVNIRVRPFTVRESMQMQPQQEERQVFAEGALSAHAPTPSVKGLRKIIQVLDERVLVFDPADSNPMARFSKSLMPGKKIKDVRYAFDHIFDESATQREVFEHTSRPLLDGIFDGFNATVFAYGATGCGKTHTISGTREDPGLIFQTFEELFSRIEAVKDDKLIDVSITYLEIYNETIRDLLIPGGSSKVLNLREDANKQISVAGLSTHVPESVEHVMELILMGNANRTISPTEANAVSSRSHAVLQVNVSQKARTANIQEDHVMATLSIIDLAGSERASVTKNRGDRLLEGANINRSLLALGNCINALCDPHRKCHVPYRDSKLTRLLKFSLGGNCRTVMVVCVSPSSAHYDETHNTLKYGNRAKNIKTKVSRNTLSVDRHVGQYVKIIYDLRQEVEELKKRLSQQNNDDTDKVEREAKLQAMRYEDALCQLRSAYDQSAAAREQRPRDIAELRRIETEMAMVGAWMNAFSSIAVEEDYSEGLAELKSVHDCCAASYKELEHKRVVLEQGLRSCSTVMAIDTVCSSLLRNIKGDNAKILCKAIEAEARLLKSKVAEQSYEAEMRAARQTLESNRSAFSGILGAAMASAACLTTDGGETEEEAARYAELYADTYQKALRVLKSFASGMSSPDAMSPMQALALKQGSRIPFASPMRSHPAHRLLSSSSSPRASPRVIRIRGSKPQTVFQKKKPAAVKKSVRWGENEETSFGSFGDSSPLRDTSTTGAFAGGSARMKPDFLQKRRSLVPVASPPGHKRSRLEGGSRAARASALCSEMATLKQIDANGSVDASITQPPVRPIKEFVRPSSANSHHRTASASGHRDAAASGKPLKSSLSSLALANLSTIMDPAIMAQHGAGVSEHEDARADKNKENHIPASRPSMVGASLSQPAMRHSLAPSSSAGSGLGRSVRVSSSGAGAWR